MPPRRGTIRAELLKSRPALRPGEVLEFVPGLIVTQHSGDGKANQYFLRGFNLDHGTDFATTVSGMPVNMPTHGHGQGYSDLNFLIPELVERIDYRKGRTSPQRRFLGRRLGRHRLPHPLDEPGAAHAGPARLPASGAGGSTALAGGRPAGRGRGPAQRRPLDAARAPAQEQCVLTLSGGTRAQAQRQRDGLRRELALHRPGARAPDRRGLQGRPFGRFDAVDPSDGGSTQRHSLSGEWHRDADGQATQLAAYAIAYRLQLFSNFTYAMERPDTATSSRSRTGARSMASAPARSGAPPGGLPARSELGLQLRQDRIRVGLFDTEARRVGHDPR
jgi:hypothetical protein